MSVRDPATRPRLQLALDTVDLPSALTALQRARRDIDIVEAGTVLCLARGMEAVRVLRSVAPDRTLLADVRIVEAGAILARLAFEAGADWVSVFGGTSLTAVEAVTTEAARHGGEVQVEIFDAWSLDAARAWRDLGVTQVVAHRSRDAEAAGELGWSARDLDRVHALADLGFAVSVTGGVAPADVARFAGAPVAAFVAGRGIRDAADPGAAAAAFQDAISAAFSPRATP